MKNLGFMNNQLKLCLWIFRSYLLLLFFFLILFFKLLMDFFTALVQSFFFHPWLFWGVSLACWGFTLCFNGIVIITKFSCWYLDMDILQIKLFSVLRLYLFLFACETDSCEWMHYLFCFPWLMFLQILMFSLWIWLVAF